MLRTIKSFLPTKNKLNPKINIQANSKNIMLTIRYHITSVHGPPYNIRKKNSSKTELIIEILSIKLHIPSIDKP